MFERYTERARRVLFFARYETSQRGGLTITAEHLLFGLLRRRETLAFEILDQHGLTLESVRKQLTNLLSKFESTACRGHRPAPAVEATPRRPDASLG